MKSQLISSGANLGMYGNMAGGGRGREATSSMYMGNCMYTTCLPCIGICNWRIAPYGKKASNVTEMFLLQIYLGNERGSQVEWERK